MLKLDMEVHTDITAIPLGTPLIGTLMHLLNLTRSPPLLLLMPLRHHLAPLLHQLLNLKPPYLHAIEQPIELPVLGGELAGPIDDHLVDEVGLPELLVVRDVLAVGGGLWVGDGGTGGNRDRLVGFAVVVYPLALVF